MTHATKFLRAALTLAIGQITLRSGWGHRYSSPVTGLLSRLRSTRLGRLLVLRWSSQASDGLFQSGLASFLLFSPERAPTALAVATGFAIVLMPYSLLGPLVGTLLDRFHRRTILLVANLVRSLLLVVIALLIARGTSEQALVPWVLACFGLSRLVLAGLSAGLPRLVPAQLLVPANAIAVTGGTLVAVIGGGIGLGIRSLTGDISNNASDAVIVAGAAMTYLWAGLSALRLRRAELGPQEHEKGGSWLAGFRDLRVGLAHLAHRPEAGWAITRIAILRGGIGALIVATILLQRNAFTDDPDTAIAGLAIVVTAMGIGSLAGAVITPRATVRFSRAQWMRLNLAVAVVLAMLFPLAQTPLLLPVIMLLIALVGQGIKVSADAEVQTTIEDLFRGRVFAVYDMGVNVAIVAGSFLAAVILPESGRSALLSSTLALLWLITLLIDLHRSRTSAQVR